MPPTPSTADGHGVARPSRPLISHRLLPDFGAFLPAPGGLPSAFARLLAALLAAAAALAGPWAAPRVTAQEAGSAVGTALCRDLPYEDAYYPPRHRWEHRSPAAVGMDSAALEAAVAFATDTANESWGPDLRKSLMQFLADEPQNNIVGPVKRRGPPAGVVVKDGYIVREWGDPHRVDMTFSVTKSFLSSVAGVAYDRGLIESVGDRVKRYAPDSLYSTPHNEKITWRHLLRQTSDWRGRLFGKPDWVDRFDGKIHEPEPPGEAWEYNDVRVNLLSLSLNHVLREPLPVVLRKEVMDPIGASSNWRWHGYETSWITLDGQKVQVVSGGGHWGGGMWISARDQARFGLLTLRCGRWDGQEILSREWVHLATTPTDAQKTYGFMNWFLNTDREFVSTAPDEVVVHAGAGINRIYVDPGHDLVVVVRWLEGDAYDEFIERVLEAVAGGG